jgi:hypothetical protein
VEISHCRLCLIHSLSPVLHVDCSAIANIVEEQIHFDSHTNLFRDMSADKTSYSGAVCGCWSQLTTDIKTVLYYSCVVLMLSVVIKDWHHINCYLTSSETVALLDISPQCKLYKILGKQSVYIWGNEECCCQRVGNLVLPTYFVHCFSIINNSAFHTGDLVQWLRLWQSLRHNWESTSLHFYLSLDTGLVMQMCFCVEY